MGKNVFLLFLIFFLSSFACAISVPEIDVQSPSSDQVVVRGSDMQIAFTTNYDMQSVDGYALANGQFIPLFHENIPVEGVKQYSTAVNTANLPFGEVTISLSAFPYSNDFGAQGQSVTILVVPQSGPPGTPSGSPPGGIPPQLPAATVLRDLPATVLAGGFANIRLIINPNTPFPGIILRENIPSEILFEGIFGGTAATYDVDFIGGEPDNLIKILGRKSDGYLGGEILTYLVQIPATAQPGDQFTIDGNWSTENSDGLIIGSGTMTVAEGFMMPGCPLSDDQLLAFISGWSRQEITNNLLLQIIEIWMSCSDSGVPT